MNTDDRVIYPILSYQVMQAVFEVHNTLGPGFIESVYEEALVFELEIRQIAFERQKNAKVWYKGRVVGAQRLDLIIDSRIVLELKAVSALTDAHISHPQRHVASIFLAGEISVSIDGDL